MSAITRTWRDGATPAVCAPIVSEGDGLMNVAAARSDEQSRRCRPDHRHSVRLVQHRTRAAPTHAADDVAAGESARPWAIRAATPAPVVVQADYSGGEQIDEGRAMAQLAHGLAPGAHLAFASANNGELDFATQIAKLRNGQSRFGHRRRRAVSRSSRSSRTARSRTRPRSQTRAGVPVLLGGRKHERRRRRRQRLVRTKRRRSRPSCRVPSRVARDRAPRCVVTTSTRPRGTDTGDDITLATERPVCGSISQWAQPWESPYRPTTTSFIVNDRAATSSPMR